MEFYCFCLLVFLFVSPCFGGTKYKFDFNWLFSLETPSGTCDVTNFTQNYNNTQCFGLSQALSSNTNATACEQYCCEQSSCQIWQWCEPGTACDAPGECWVGTIQSCGSGPGWISSARSLPPQPGPNCFNNYCLPNLTDSSWRALNVPHDFVVEGNFTPTASQSHGYLPQGVGWYRKHFNVSGFEGKSIRLEFDGAYRNTDAWLNGVYLGNHPSGYTSFMYDITDYVTFLEENVFAIRVDATFDEGWWYEGGGIYRHVWLVESDLLHFAHWGTQVSSIINGTISPEGVGQVASSVVVSISAGITNNRTTLASFQVQARIYDANGNGLGTALFSDAQAAGQSESTVLLSITLTNVALWSPDSPTLYTLVTNIVEDGSVITDSHNTTFGIRKVVFDYNLGLFVNDVPIKVQGLCNHQDFAGLGTALPDRVNEFRVAKLKEMGANAWRMSHNPPNPELLDWTDQLGMLVWDENRNFGNTPQYLDDVGRLVLRDRSHPSIILWSLCNEAGCSENANDTNALSIAMQMKGIIENYDPTRPVSAAWNSDVDDLLWGWGPLVLDVQGVNYNYGEFGPYHEMYPTMPMISSETASCTCARGIYVSNDTACHRDVYSADACAVQWWTADITNAFMAGGFAWTGFDYKGEPTPYSWPDINSNFGILDICGFEKDTFYYYQSVWQNASVVHVLPHWNNPVPASSQGLSVLSCSSSQNDTRFTFSGSSHTSGLIVSVQTGLCVDASCGDVQSGCAPLFFAPCNTSDPNQLFQYTSSNNFQNVANGGCMDLWDSGTSTEVGVYSCDGGSNQQWTINSAASQIANGMQPNECLAQSNAVPVWVYSNAASVEIFLNGDSQGVQAVPPLNHVAWAVPYIPGNLTAVGYSQSGAIVGVDTRLTAGTPSAIVLSVDYPSGPIYADNQDSALIRASIVDIEGNVVPTSSNFISFFSNEFGSIIGVGNGDPSCHEPDKASTRSAFNGLARAILQATFQAGTITVTATSPGLAPGSVSVISVPPLNPYPIV